MVIHIKTSISPKCKNTKNDKMCNSQNTEMTKKWSKNDENRGGLISALKPGPVVPPGIEKTPDQAARISQSAVFGHLSDILAFFRGGSIFVTFLCFFTFLIFHFWWFLILSFFVFCHFFCFLDFVTFSLLMILINFCHFFMFVINLCHFLLSN